MGDKTRVPVALKFKTDDGVVHYATGHLSGAFETAACGDTLVINISMQGHIARGYRSAVRAGKDEQVTCIGCLGCEPGEFAWP